MNINDSNLEKIQTLFRRGDEENALGFTYVLGFSIEGPHGEVDIKAIEAVRTVLTEKKYILERQLAFASRQFRPKKTGADLLQETLKEFIYRLPQPSPTDDGFVVMVNDDTLYFASDSEAVVVQMLDDVSELIRTNKVRERKAKRTIYMINRNQHGFFMRNFSLDDLVQDLSETEMLTNYNEDFPAAHANLTSFLESKNQGLVLLHGVPGTGKTSYVKHILGTPNLPRQFVYVPVNMLQYFSEPGFFDFLQEHPQKIYFVEDAETLLRKREDERGNSVAIANLLNTTDGVLGTLIDSQFICTFNGSRDHLDSALLRKGRLRVEYEFKALEQTKAQALLDKVRPGTKADGPMTLADIYNAT